MQYTYDLAGNRVKAVRTPRPSGAGANDTRQEQENGYDRFDRLTGSATTSFDSGNTATSLNSDAWTLDAFGNWLTRASTLPGGTGRTIDSTPDTRNRYALIETTQGGSPQPDVTPIYDGAGNLIFDGSYAYQYDGWGRLLQVNQATVAAGHAGDLNYLTVGELIKHFTYDAFGRLARVQSPYPGVPGPNEAALGLRSERFNYDGVRRIQETFTDPVFGLGKAMEGVGGEALRGVAEEVRSKGPEEMDAAAAPASLEAGQAQLMEESGPVFGGTSTTYLAREYVWGPGDWGVDELLAQFDQDRKASYPVQDAGGDVISLIDLGGGGGGGGTARTVANIVYDAYGRVIAHEHLFPHAYLRTGHKGLFFDRLDAGVADGSTYEETPRLVAGSTLLGQNRNRTLNTSWGRFLQSDPNATGVAVMDSVAFHGEGFGAFVQSLDLDLGFDNGPNHYGYLGQTPFAYCDPKGLFFSLGDVMGASTWQSEFQSEWADDSIDYGRTLADSVYFQLADIGDEQWMMLEIAMDWSAGDDLFGVGMTAGGGSTFRFPGAHLDDMAIGWANEQLGPILAENDHAIPRLMGGPDDDWNIFKLAMEEHRGAGGRSRHGNLRALMREAGLPLTSKVLNSKKWQQTMAIMVRQNPEAAQKLADALLENAKFVEKTAPGYLAKMKGALSKVKFSWMPKGVKFRVR